MIPQDFIVRKKRQTTDSMMMDNHNINQNHNHNNQIQHPAADDGTSRMNMMMNMNMTNPSSSSTTTMNSMMNSGNMNPSSTTTTMNNNPSSSPTTMQNMINMNMNSGGNVMMMNPGGVDTTTARTPSQMMNPGYGVDTSRTPSPSATNCASILSTSYYAATGNNSGSESSCCGGEAGGGIFNLPVTTTRNRNNRNNNIGAASAVTKASSSSKFFSSRTPSAATTTTWWSPGGSSPSFNITKKKKKPKLGHHHHNTTSTSTKTSVSKNKKKNKSNSNNNMKKKVPPSSTTQQQQQQQDPNQTTNPKFDGTDADIAKEMNALSVDERERVYDDIHGVASQSLQKLETQPQYIETHLKLFDTALNKIPKTKKKSLERAYFLNPLLSKDSKFKLMFLRADLFNIDKAVDRYIKFFDGKKRLWGEENLGKTITLDDLNEDDINAVNKDGFTLQLPVTDTTDRPILQFDITKFNYYKHQNMLRFTWYMMMCAIQESEEAQRQGVVIVSYLPSKRSGNIVLGKFLEMLSRSDNSLGKTIPIRVTGYHFCTDSQSLQFVLSMLRVGHSKDVRLRLRAHFGSELEMQYSLLTYGIPDKISILLFAGDGPTELHTEYLQKRKQIEDEVEEAKKKKQQQETMAATTSTTKTTATIIDYPSPKDALIGRGHPYHDFVGTRVIIKQVDSQLGRYKEVLEDRFMKSCLNMEVVQNFKEYTGGRFLQRKANIGWQLMDDNMAREKIGNLFRYRMKLAVEKQQQQQQQQQRELLKSSSPSSFDDNDDNGDTTMTTNQFMTATMINDNNNNNKRPYQS